MGIDVKLRHVEVLADMLENDTADEVRLAVAVAFQSQGRAVLRYFDVLEKAARDDTSRWVRHAALDVLVNFPEAAPILLALLSADDCELRRRVLKELGRTAADFSERGSTNRQAIVTARVEEKTDEQNRYFEERKE